MKTEVIEAGMERMRDRIESLEDKMMGSGSEHGKEPEKQMQKDVTVAESQGIY